MSNWTVGLRRAAAEKKQEQREARRSLQNLARMQKEQAAQETREHAALEVELFEAEIAYLLSVHKDDPLSPDWMKLAASLDPPTPSASGFHRFACAVQIAHSKPFADSATAAEAMERAEALDEQSYRARMAAYTQMAGETQGTRRLARAILRHDLAAFAEAVDVFAPLSDVVGIRPEPRIEIVDAKLLLCEIVVNGREVVPAVVKVVTSGGKLSTRPMAKVRFHALYQDYVCSCVLRAARDLLALLPVDEVLITVFVPDESSSADLPVLSAILSRTTMETLDFGHLDPSDTIGRFFHRGDVLVSRQSGSFSPIVPLTVAEVSARIAKVPTIAQLQLEIRRQRIELAARLSFSESSLASDSR